MKPLEFPTSFLTSSDPEDLTYLQTLIRRKQILPAILKMHIEDYIISNIDLDDQFLEQKEFILGNTPYDEFLSKRNWRDSDFIIFYQRMRLSEFLLNHVSAQAWKNIFSPPAVLLTKSYTQYCVIRTLVSFRKCGFV